MESLSPSVKRSLLFLRHSLDKATWPDGTQLPKVGQLARETGVAKSAMGQALRILAKENKVTVRPRVGTFAGKCAPTANAERKPYRWESVRTRMERDIFEGHFRAGAQLPSVKELQLRYTACSRTVHKALNALCITKAVVRRGRRFHVQKQRGISPMSTIMVIGSKNKMGDFYISARNQELVRALGRECAHYGVAIDMAAYALESGGYKPH
jgi:DNA-binding GntR family transcriptional regulator